MPGSRLAAIVLCGLVGACSGTSPGTSPTLTVPAATTTRPSTAAPTKSPTPTTPRPTATELPTPSPSPASQPQLGLGWTATSLAPAPQGDGSEVFVINSTFGVIVIGHLIGGWQRWLSSDAVAWDMAPIPAFDRAPHKYEFWRLLRVVRLHDQLVAVATADKPDHIQFWTSADGTDWTQVPDNADFAFAKASERPQFEPGIVPGCCGEVTDIRADGESVVVEGSPPRADPCDICELEPRKAVVRWTSTDGTEWDRTVVAPDYAYTGREVGLRAGSGFIRLTAINEEHAGVEASTDRQSWTVVWQTTASLNALHAYSGGFLAVGASAEFSPEIVAASSVDGTEWIQTSGWPDMAGAMLDFVEFDGTLVAVGLRQPFDPGQPPVVWVSPPLS